MSNSNEKLLISVPIEQVVERVSKGEVILYQASSLKYRVKAVLKRENPDCCVSEWGAADLERIGIAIVDVNASFYRELQLVERDYRDGDAIESIIKDGNEDFDYTSECGELIAAHWSADGQHVVVFRDDGGTVCSRYVSNLKVRVYE